MELPSLKFNTALLFHDYYHAMSQCLDRLLDRYYREVESALRTDAGKNALRKERLNEDEKLMLWGRVIGGAWAVMDSYGTGSLADTSNPALGDYMGGDIWNPERPRVPGAPITGRPAGEYTNIFGEQATSSGRLAGANLERPPGSPIKPRSPSFAFQNAEKWFEAENMAKEAIDEATRAFFAEVNANSGRYFSLG